EKLHAAKRATSERRIARIDRAIERVGPEAARHAGAAVPARAGAQGDGCRTVHVEEIEGKSEVILDVGVADRDVASKLIRSRALEPQHALGGQAAAGAGRS